MKYILEISMEQAEIIKIALEEFFRLRMNQVSDFADSIAFEGFDYKNPIKEEFEKSIDRKEYLENVLRAVLDVVHPLAGREQCIEMRRAQDIWQVIRRRLYLDCGGDPDGWGVAAREPMSLTDEELPKMERTEE